MEEILKILVVDDDEVDRMAVRRALKAAGVAVEVSEAGDCAAAIAKLQQQEFDCAFVDYCLPDGDGLTLLQSVRRAGIQVATIVLTGQGDEQIAVELMKAGASDYLSKAKIAPHSLSRSLRNAVRIHKAEIEAALASGKLKESEERYRLVLEGSNDGIWDWDIAKNEIYWNDRFFEIIGGSRAEFDGTWDAFYERLHPDDQKKIKDEIQAHLEGGVEYNVEFRIRHTSGEYRYCFCRGKAQRNRRGIPQRMAGIISDITERKQAEEQLLKQHRRSQLLAEMTLKIRQSLQIEEILQTTVQEVRQLLATDRVLIYRQTPDGLGEVVTEAVVPGYPPILGASHHRPLFGETYLKKYRQGRISAIATLEQADIQPCDLELMQQFEVKAYLVVPILQSEQTIPNKKSQIKNRLWGLLIAHQCATKREWTSFEIELLQQLADQVSIALAQAQLLEQQTRASVALADQNVALEQALKNLQQTQSQLIQAEKMSALGQLVAGVAHEINNPVTFIYGNITPAQQYIEDLLHLLQLYEQHYPMPDGEIQAVREEIDLDFMISDLLKLLSSLKVGAERIREIVLCLRNFSRLDEAKMKAVDIHEGLDNTLLLLQQRLQKQARGPAIQVIKEYGDLPLVECYAGSVNQVFMNILSNAIDALEQEDVALGFDPGRSLVRVSGVGSVEFARPELSRGGVGSVEFARPELGRKVASPLHLCTSAPQRNCTSAPSIRIRTEVLEGDRVSIRIADNGPGISEQVRERLFDPFFTTKQVGKGTGLGLSISYQILVEKHGGSLECISAPGQGAEFAISIPIRAATATSHYQGETCPVVLHA